MCLNIQNKYYGCNNQNQTFYTTYSACQVQRAFQPHQQKNSLVAIKSWRWHSSRFTTLHFCQFAYQQWAHAA